MEQIKEKALELIIAVLNVIIKPLGLQVDYTTIE
jgi:hypothetical protein